jgi:hypothetical protein
MDFIRGIGPPMRRKKIVVVRILPPQNEDVPIFIQYSLEKIYVRNVRRTSGLFTEFFTSEPAHGRCPMIKFKFDFLPGK